MVARELRAAPDENRRTSAADLHRVISHEPVTAHDEVERALALADAALSGHEHAQPQDVEQHTVPHFPWRKSILEQRGQARDGDRRRRLGAQQWHTRLLGFLDELDRRLEAERQQHARQVAREEARDRLTPRGRIHLLEIPDFALAKDQHAARTQIGVEAGKGQARLLDEGNRDATIEARRAGQHVEIQAAALAAQTHERADTHTGRHRGRLNPPGR